MIRKVLLLLTFTVMSISVLFAQNRQITGVVKDDTGEPLPGVGVAVKNSTVGTQTNVDGKFTLNVPNENTVLVFRYIGFKTKEVTVGSQTTVNVVLEQEATLLNEVVAIGYGTVQKKDLTGAVASINAETIAAAPVSSALEAIQGRVAGVNISSTEGSPDAEMTVRVRGGGSITGDNSPLYIVDGFPLNSIADIAPQDIESIDVLKDASSTAIYGSRGANGVVIVTTKSGKEGKTSISFNTFGGVRNLANKLNVLSPYDYVTWQYERALLDNSLSDYTDFFGAYQDIDLYKDVAKNDWQEIIFGRTGNTYNQNLNISGGGEKTKFSISHNFVKDKAIMQLSGYERQNVNFKLNHKLYKKLTLDLGARYSDTKIEGGGMNEQKEVSSGDSRLKFAMIYPPIPVQGLTTTDEIDDEFNLYNPLQSIRDNDQLIKRKTYNLNAALNYEIIKDLKLRSEVGYDNYGNEQDRFYGTTTYYVRDRPTAENKGLPALIFTNTGRNSFRNTNTLNYNFKKHLNKSHNLTALLGHEYIKTQQVVKEDVIHGFPRAFDFQSARKLSGIGKANSVNNFEYADDILLSFFTRANYDFEGKYLLSATFRADGSSKFGAGNKWGYFPSVSAGWRISQENFMENTKSWLADLKLRASYGTAGNNNIPTGQIDPVLGVQTTTWVNGFNSYLSTSKIMANPDLKWETTVTRNLGLDFALWNSKLYGAVEAYKNSTKDLLILFPVSGVGYDNQYRNLGETENKGLEFSLNWNAVRKKNFDLTASANISFNRNKVVSLGGLGELQGNSNWASSEISSDFLIQEGYSVGRMYGYVSDGRYEVSDFDYNPTTDTWTLKAGVVDVTSVVGTPRPGTMKLRDLNGDLKVTSSDRTVIGNANPLHTGGFSVNSRIFNFDVAAYFNWSYGNDIYNANKIEYTSTSKYHSRNMIDIMGAGNRWNNLLPDGTLSTDPAQLEEMNRNTTMWSPYMSRFAFSDWAVEDGAFLRLSTLTLGYTLPTSISSRLKMQKVRFYVSGYNLHVWTNYTGFDPEVSTRRQTPLTPGVDYSAYPRSKSYILGLNVSF